MSVMQGIDPVQLTLAKADLEAQCRVKHHVNKANERRLSLLKRLEDYDEYPDTVNIVFPPDSQGNPDPHDGPDTKWLEARYVLHLSPTDICARYGDAGYDIYSMWGADGGSRLWGDTVVWMMRDESLSCYVVHFSDSAKFYGVPLETYTKQFVGNFFVVDLKSEFATVLQMSGLTELSKICKMPDIVLGEQARKALCKYQQPIDVLSPLLSMKKDNQAKVHVESMMAAISSRNIDQQMRLAEWRRSTNTEAPPPYQEQQRRERSDIPAKMPKLVESVGARFNVDSDSDSELLSDDCSLEQE